MQRKRSTRVSNKVIVIVLVLAVAVAVLGTFASLMDIGSNMGITGATSVDDQILKEPAKGCETEINQTKTAENFP